MPGLEGKKDNEALKIADLYLTNEQKELRDLKA